MEKQRKSEKIPGSKNNILTEITTKATESITNCDLKSTNNTIDMRPESLCTFPETQNSENKNLNIKLMVVPDDNASKPEVHSSSVNADKISTEDVPLLKTSPDNTTIIIKRSGKGPISQYAAAFVDEMVKKSGMKIAESRTHIVLKYDDLNNAPPKDEEVTENDCSTSSMQSTHKASNVDSIMLKGNEETKVQSLQSYSETESINKLHMPSKSETIAKLRHVLSSSGLPSETRTSSTSNLSGSQLASIPSISSLRLETITGKNQPIAPRVEATNNTNSKFVFPPKQTSTTPPRVLFLPTNNGHKATTNIGSTIQQITGVSAGKVTFNKDSSEGITNATPSSTGNISMKTATSQICTTVPGNQLIFIPTTVGTNQIQLSPATPLQLDQKQGLEASKKPTSTANISTAGKPKPVPTVQQTTNHPVFLPGNQIFFIPNSGTNIPASKQGQPISLMQAAPLANTPTFAPRKPGGHDQGPRFLPPNLTWVPLQSRGPVPQSFRGQRPGMSSSLPRFPQPQQFLLQNQPLPTQQVILLPVGGPVLSAPTVLQPALAQHINKEVSSNEFVKVRLQEQKSGADWLLLPKGLAPPKLPSPPLPRKQANARCDQSEGDQAQVPETLKHTPRGVDAIININKEVDVEEDEEPMEVDEESTIGVDVDDARGMDNDLDAQSSEIRFHQPKHDSTKGEVSRKEPKLTTHSKVSNRKIKNRSAHKGKHSEDALESDQESHQADGAAITKDIGTNGPLHIEQTVSMEDYKGPVDMYLFLPPKAFKKGSRTFISLSK